MSIAFRPRPRHRARIAIPAAVVPALAALLLPAAEPARAAPVDEAVAVVRALYAAHARAFVGEAPPVHTGGPASLRFFDSRLARRMRQAELGFDPLYDGQDAKIDDLRIRMHPRLRVLRGTAHVLVSFRNFGKPVRLTYLLRRNPAGKWRIIDIHSPDWKLSDMLRKAR